MGGTAELAERKLYKTLRKQRMREPGAGERKKWEWERSKRHIAYKIREMGRRWKNRRSILSVSQRKK